MKVGITDLRRNPGIVNIEGKRLVFPSRREVVRDISSRAYNLIKQFPFLKVEVKDTSVLQVECKDSQCKGEITEVVEEVPASKPVQEEPKHENIAKEVKEIQHPAEGAEEIKTEEPDPMLAMEVESLANDSQDQEVMEDSSIISPDSSSTNFQAMSKRDLRALIESKGGDPQGMSKATMVNWLENN